MTSDVLLNTYKLHKLSPGVYHTGLVVNGIEYSFSMYSHNGTGIYAVVRQCEIFRGLQNWEQSIYHNQNLTAF